MSGLKLNESNMSQNKILESLMNRPVSQGIPQIQTISMAGYNKDTSEEVLTAYKNYKQISANSSKPQQTKTLKISELLPTQMSVRLDDVFKCQSKEYSKQTPKIIVVEYKDSLYVVENAHLMVSQKMKGFVDISAVYVNL